MNSLINWTRIAGTVEEMEFPPSGLKEISVIGRKFCLALVKGQLFATSALCPHAGGNLTAGYVDPTGHIVCPVHRYKFSLKNGYNSSGEGYHLKTFPVELRADGIYLGITGSHPFSG